MKPSYVLTVSALIVIACTSCNPDNDISDGCYEGSFYISKSSDAEILNDYSCITGSVTVELFDDPSGQPYIDLTNITKIGVDLILDQSALESLNGFDNLKTIGGNLEIWGNSYIDSLEGLNGLVSVGGDFTIQDNGNLTSLDGLDSLESVQGNFEIWQETLEKIGDLTNLTTVGGSLDIWETSIISLDGLNGVTDLGSLWISSNSELESITEMENFSSITQDFHIVKNPKLGYCSICALAVYLNTPLDVEPPFTYFQNNMEDECIGSKQDIFVFNDLNCP